MSKIADWLSALGMAEYADRFAENHIDFSVLGDLTDQDLKDLGVVIGDRRKMQRAISQLSAQSTTPRPPILRDHAERRQLTVMFCDLVGSTALSARLDPEDLRAVMGDYQRCCAAIVERNGGFVAKYLGDGVLAYFGYPHAHEHDAERAVRAGLALIEAVPALPAAAGAPLAVRVGIATGLVVVGDLTGSGETQERGVVGETPNLAACLQGTAEPNTVVLSEGTRRLLGNLFDLVDLGPRELKGIGRQRVWAALRASAFESRFDALRMNDLAAFIGRKGEAEILRASWSKAKSGLGQVVLVWGEAGIGKSRLTAFLLEHIDRESHKHMRYFCSAQHADSALYPIIGQMERTAGFAREDKLAAKLDKLDVLLAQTAAAVEDVVLIAEMLSLSNDGRYPDLALAPSQRRQRTLAALVSRFAAMAAENPILMIFEDAHWIDPTSLEVLDLMVNRIAALPALLVVTYRPEFEPPSWIGKPHVTELTINRLAQNEVCELIDRIAGDAILPAGIREDIAERTDGIPLFVEEMTKAVLEADNESSARRTITAAPSPSLAVPASLHASLMARLDRLGPAKELAQIGAAIGRVFSHALLSAVTHKSEVELQSALDRLIQAGLLFPQGSAPQMSYIFKHALVQDAAYSTLLRETRRALHARIADALEHQFSDAAETQSEVLARHATEAGQIEKAIRLWGKAAQRSMARSALAEATAHLGRALAQIGGLPGTPALRREEIKLQVALANAQMHTKGYAASETRSSLDRARDLMERMAALGEQPEDPLILFAVLYGYWVANYSAFNGDANCSLAKQFLELAERQGNAALLMAGHRLTGVSLFHTGNIADGHAHLERAKALYVSAENRAQATPFGDVDPGVAILSRLCLTNLLLGYPDAALAEIESTLEVARKSSHATSLMQALTLTAVTLMSNGNHAAAKEQIEEAVALADAKGATFWRTLGMLLHGCVLALTNEPLNAVQLITQGLNGMRAMGATMQVPFCLIYQAQAHAALAQFDDARRCVDDAIRMMKATKETSSEAEAHRTAGEIALMLPEPDRVKARAHFEDALAIARRQQAKAWELRAATSLALLWRDQGEPQRAYDVLAPVYDWFTQGFDTQDLLKARALLDTLIDATPAAAGG